MSVKTTRTLTRSDAVTLYARLRAAEAEKLFASFAALTSDSELQDELMRLNDAAHGGEGFENYRISDEGRS